MDRSPRQKLYKSCLVHQWSVLTRSELNMETRISSRMGISWKIAEKLVELSY